MRRQSLRGAGAPRAHGGVSALLSALMAVLLVLLGALHRGDLRILPNTLPWQPVDLNAPPGWIVHWQLARLARDGPACRAALERTPAMLTAMKDRRIDDACGFRDVLRVDRAPVAFVPRTTATCGLTAALYWWQMALQKAAAAWMHARLTRIDQLGTFACRNINSEKSGPRSEHATANAIDVAAFHFSDGRTVTVARDYGKRTAQGSFLDAAHDAACGLFNGTLGPRYNALHANHFHLDMGPYRICA